MHPLPTSTLFPYTTLFRSAGPGSLRHGTKQHIDAGAMARHQGAVAHQRQCVVDRKSTRLNSSHANISYAVFCLKKKNAAGALDVIQNAVGAERAGAEVGIE